MLTVEKAEARAAALVELARKAGADAADAIYVGDASTSIQVRLGALEDQLHPSAYLTDAQASDIAAAVKALAELLSARDASKNHYQGVFTELYRRFRVSSYKQLRQDQYAPVIAFLADWSHAIQAANSAPPKD